MKTTIYYIIALVLFCTSCTEDVTTEEENDSANPKSTVSFKVNGTLFELSRQRDDPGMFPVIRVTNDSENGLNVLFGEDQNFISFSGTYLSNSSGDYKVGYMEYESQGFEHLFYSDSDDQCNSDLFSLQIRKQNGGIASMPLAVRFTGTFSGRLVYYHGDPQGTGINNYCANPEFLEITDGKFDIIGLEL